MRENRTKGDAMANRFDFGGGHVFIGNIEIDGTTGIVISHSEEAHGVGDKNPEWANGESLYYPKEDDVLLMATKRDGATVLRNMVDSLCLRMDGFTVED